MVDVDIPHVEAVKNIESIFLAKLFCLQMTG